MIEKTGVTVISQNAETTQVMETNTIQPSKNSSTNVLNYFSKLEISQIFFLNNKLIFKFLLENFGKSSQN